MRGPGRVRSSVACGHEPDASGYLVREVFDELISIIAANASSFLSVKKQVSQRF
jgi:hypothetical protein